MRNVLGVLVLVLGTILLAVCVSLLLAVVASWCFVGLCALLQMVGVMLPFVVEWSWELVVVFWFFGIIVALLVRGFLGWSEY